MPMIKEMYAFCSQEKPGDEGIVAYFTGEAWMPMVGADMARMESLKQEAIKLGKRCACSVTLKKFKLVSEETVYEYRPQ
jgi:hypothetical protein